MARVVAVVVLAVAIVSIFVGNATENGRIQSLVSSRDDTIARQYVRLLMQGQIRSLVIALGSSSSGLNDWLDLNRAASLLPKRSPNVLRIVGYQASVRQAIVNYEDSDGLSWAIVSVAIKKDEIGLDGLHVYTLRESLEKSNRFTLVGKSYIQIALLIVAVSIGIFQAFTLIFCAWIQTQRLRWVWMIASMCGLGEVSMNLTTGAIVFDPVAVSFSTVQFQQAGDYAPWLIAFWLPLGALTYWLFRARPSTG